MITIDDNREFVKYTGQKQTYLMNMIILNCTCRYYFCYAMCSHLYAASEKYNISLIPQHKIQAKSFVLRKPKGKPSGIQKEQLLVAQGIAYNKKVTKINEQLERANPQALITPVEPVKLRSKSCASKPSTLIQPKIITNSSSTYFDLSQSTIFSQPLLQQPQPTFHEQQPYFYQQSQPMPHTFTQPKQISTPIQQSQPARKQTQTSIDDLLNSIVPVKMGDTQRRGRRTTKK